MYQSLRQGRVLPPLVPGVPAPRSLGERNELFVYVHGFAQNNQALMAALAAVTVPARAYIPGITPQTRQRLANFIIHDDPVPVADIVARSRCVVHHGGIQLTAVCLATGTPQVILSKELDNRAAAAYVDGQGLGAGGELAGASTEWLTEVIGRAYGDEEMRQRCAAAADAFHAQWFAKDPTEVLASFVLDRIGAPPIAMETITRRRDGSRDSRQPKTRAVAAVGVAPSLPSVPLPSVSPPPVPPPPSLAPSLEPLLPPLVSPLEVPLVPPLVPLVPSLLPLVPFWSSCAREFAEEFPCSMIVMKSKGLPVGGSVGNCSP